MYEGPRREKRKRVVGEIYMVFIKYCVFVENVVIFLNSVSSAAVLVFDLPLCTHTDTEGKPREIRVRNIFENLRKNTIFNEHPVCLGNSLLLSKQF